MHRFLLITLSILSISAYSQQIYSGNTYPLNNFRQPLDITPAALAGSFGELRSNHFHSGLDFKTNKREGYPVYAVADGYISRLRVQNSGFGLAIYINHPNGYTSVYGHLQRFAPKIAEQVKSIQYAKKSYEIDEYPKETLIPIHKGDVIAYSGNTGSSGGPHLHFEIRDTKTEETINPQLFGISIPDNIKPVISALYVYRLNGKSFNEFTPKQYFQIIGSNGNYSINSVNTINLFGEVGFGIITTDKHNGLSGTNGVYSIQLMVDNLPVFTSALERFKFETSKAINAHIDYPTLINLKRNIQKSFVDPGNPLNIYSNLVNNGIINFSDGKLHQIKYIVTDAKGNQSELNFNVQSNNIAIINTPEQKEGITFNFNKLNEFQTADVKVFIPKGSLYNDLKFVYKTLPKPPLDGYSAIHQVQNKLTPLHTGFNLWIKPDSTIAKFKNKAIIVNTDRVSQGGYFEDGFVKATPKNFGSFYVTVDTIAPKIIPINISNGKNMHDASKIMFTISDNLSGIKSFNGFIDGEWVLMEFDSKSGMLFHRFDERTNAGKHTLDVIVNDMKENVKKHSIDFYR